MGNPDDTSGGTRRSLTFTLMRRLSLAFLLAVLALGLLDWHIAVRRLEHELHQEASRTGAALVEVLREPLWNLDEAAVRQRLLDYPPAADLTAVRVLTQFGDLLHRQRYEEPDTDRLVVRTPVRHQGELIGHIEVDFSRERVREARAAAVRRTATRGLLGVAAVVALTGLCLNLYLRRPLTALIRDVRRLAAGQYELRLPPARYAEIDQVYREVNAMAGQIAGRTRQLEAEIDERRAAEARLLDYRAHLEDTVQERTVALTDTNRRLEAEIAKRRRAQAETLEISNWEQRRIGQDLHDTLGQMLTGANLYAEALAGELRATDRSAAAKARKIGDVLHHAVIQVRLTARGLNPQELRGPGLLFALRQLVQDTRTLSAVECELSADGAWNSLNEDIATHLYRITQESVANALRHGHGSHIQIRLERADAHTGRLSIADNGQGLGPATPEETHDGIGLRTMRARAEALGGTFAIRSGPNGGTVVCCTFAIPATDTPDA